MRLNTLPTVLLPGWGFTPAVWEVLIAALERHGIQRNRLLPLKLPLCPQQTLTQTLEALASRLPAQAHLIGWSLGGELALALAQSLAVQTNQLASLTLVSSTPCFMNRADWAAGQPVSLLDDFDQRLVANPIALLKRFSMLIRHGDTDATRNRALTENLMHVNDTDQARLAAGLSLLREIDVRANVAAVRIPARIIHGTQDAVTPLAAATWLQQHIPDATLHTINGASHALPLTHTEALATAIATMTEHPA